MTKHLCLSISGRYDGQYIVTLHYNRKQTVECNLMTYLCHICQRPWHKRVPWVSIQKAGSQ